LNDDPRYLAGVVLFNEQEFFEAHEVWEDLWAESHGYMNGLPEPFQGMDLTRFWLEMTNCFAPLLAYKEGDPVPELTNDMLPTIVLDPPPAVWPNPADFIRPEH
jgi:hypothetical protein